MKSAEVETGLCCRLWLVVCIVIIIGTFSACRKKDDPQAKDGSQIRPADNSQGANATVQDENLELITETEEKERDDFRSQVRSLAFKGDFAQLESIAKELRDSKSRFRNGYWKLRAFYTAFGDFPEESPE